MLESVWGECGVSGKACWGVGKVEGDAGRGIRCGER